MLHVTTFTTWEIWMSIPYGHQDYVCINGAYVNKIHATSYPLLSVRRMHADTPNRRRHSASTAALWSQSEVINCCLTTFSATWRDEIALCQQRDVIIYITAPDVARLYVLNWTNSFILPLTTARTHTSISMWKTALFFSTCILRMPYSP